MTYRCTSVTWRTVFQYVVQRSRVQSCDSCATHILFSTTPTWTMLLWSRGAPHQHIISQHCATPLSNPHSILTYIQFTAKSTKQHTCCFVDHSCTDNIYQSSRRRRRLCGGEVRCKQQPALMPIRGSKITTIPYPPHLHSQPIHVTGLNYTHLHDTPTPWYY
jgi:hypothetical protein